MTSVLQSKVEGCLLLMQLLGKLAKRAQLQEKISGMYEGKHLNVTEDRAVLHVALRARRDQVLSLLIA